MNSNKKVVFKLTHVPLRSADPNEKLAAVYAIDQLHDVSVRQRNLVSCKTYTRASY